MGDTRHKICDVADVPPGTVRRVELPGCPALVVCNVRGSFRVLEDCCTHGEASLAGGRLVGPQIECPLHLGRFDVHSGMPTARPAKVPQPTFPVEVDGGAVFVREEDLARSGQPARARSKVSSYRGLDQHYVAWGDRGGDPVILIHGLRGYGHWFDDLAEVLVADHDVVAPDLRGRGASGHSPDGDYRTDVYVDDLEDLMAALGTERPAIVGHSLGARVAMLYASRHPERVSSLVLLDMGPTVELEGTERIRNEMAATPSGFASWAEAEEFVRSAHPANDERIRARLQWALQEQADGSVRWSLDDAIFSSRPPHEPPSRMWRALSRVGCPTLVVRGERSDVLSEKTALFMVDMLPPGSRYAEIPSAGHMLLDDNATATSQAVAEFLKPGGEPS